MLVNRARLFAYLLRITLLFFVGFAVFSCSDKEDDFLTLSADKFNIAVSGEETTFTVSSNADWNVVLADSWVTVGRSTGSGEASVTLKVNANYSDQDRSTTLTVTCGALAETIKISQSTLSFSLSASEIVFDTSGTVRKLTVTSNAGWSLAIPREAAWCTADVLSGEGDAVITLTPAPYTDRIVRGESTVVFSSLNTTKPLVISQEFPNEAPSAPVLLTPANTSREIVPPVCLTWEASTDADGDEVMYSVFLSADGVTWGEPFAKTASTTVSLTADDVEDQTTYYWKVAATDTFGAESESSVYHFTTKERGLYADGEYAVCQTYSAAGATRPANLVITGDGFIDADYAKGGAFDIAVEKAIRAFFSVEPYPTYRDYFTVYKVAAYSEERGATVTKDFTDEAPRKQTRKTVFNSILEGGTSTGIKCNYEAVFNYALKIPAITRDDLVHTTVLVLINLDVYAGTTIMYSDGKGIAMCPTGDTLEEIVYHEGGGHAFGRLLDEYIYHPSQSMPSTNIQTVENFRKGYVWNFGANISFTDNRESVHWKHYFGKPGYEMVGLYEGGYLYGAGVWRPEENSCMNDNVPFFNAPSREAIVRRIMSISNQSFNYTKFYEKDRIQTGQARRSRAVKTPLAPPVLME